MSRRCISFTVSDEKKKAEIEEYAALKGFRTPADLARFALFQYITRYPINKPQGGTA